MDYDVFLINLIGDLKSPALDSFMLFATYLGSGSLTAFLGIFAALFLFWRKKYNYLAIFLASFVLGEIIARSMKYLVARPRPEILTQLVHSEGFSFPSGHAFTTTVFWGVLAYMMTKEIKNKTARGAVWIIASLIILTVGFSRVYLGVHWPSDILGGFAIAIIWMISVAYFFKKHPLENNKNLC